MNKNILQLVFLLCISASIYSQNAYYDAMLIDNIASDINALKDAKNKVTEANLKKLNVEKKNKAIAQKREEIRNKYKDILDTIVSSESKELFITTKYLDEIRALPNGTLNITPIIFDPLSNDEIIFIDFLVVYIRDPFSSPSIIAYKNKLGQILNNIYTKIKNYNAAVEDLKIDTKGSSSLEPVPVTNLRKVNTSVSQSEQVNLKVSSGNVTSNSTVSKNFYDALATFLVERFKEELVLEVIDKVKKYFRENEKLFKYFIPETYKLIQSVSFSQYVRMSDLKSSLVEDFNNLPVNGKRFIEENGYNTTVPEFNYLILGINIWEALKNGEHPLKVILKSKDSIFKIFNISSILSSDYTNLIDGLDKYFRVVSEDKKEISWISQDVLENLTQEQENFLVCIFMDYANLNTYKLSFSGKTGSLIIAYRDFLKALELVKNSIDRFNKNDESSADKLQEYIDKSFELFVSSMTVLNQLSSTPLANIDNIKIHYDNIKSIYKAVIKKNYTYATTIFINKYLMPAIENYSKNTNYAEVALSVNTIMKYIGFASEIASAQSGEEMKEIIENFALPPLSIKTKRKAEFDISLIGSPGLMFGGEFNYANNNKSQNAIYGVTVPIGLDFSWSDTTAITETMLGDTTDEGIELIEYDGSSIGFTITVLDIAAIFKYRFKEGSGEIKDIDKLTFENLFSPGIIFKYGIANSPLSFGIGLQWTPKLREIINGETTIKSNSLTLCFNLNWDIALINLHRTGF